MYTVRKLWCSLSVPEWHRARLSQGCFIGECRTAIDAAIYRAHVGYIISTPAQFLYKIDGTGAGGQLAGRRTEILLDFSRVYVRSLPFVSGRAHLGRLNIGHLELGSSKNSWRLSDFAFATRLRRAKSPEPHPLRVSADDTIQMDHNAVVLFTIDRLDRSPRTA